MSSLIVIISIIEVDHKIRVLFAVDIDCDKAGLIICLIFMKAILDFYGKSAYRF